MTLAGGPVSILLGFMAVAAVVIFLERFLELRRAQVDWQYFVDGVLNVLERGNVDEALANCDDTAVPVANVVATAIRHRDASARVLKESVDAQGRAEVGRLNRRLAALAIIGQISPLLGLLGTVIGFIRTVMLVSSQSLVARADLMEASMDALVPAALGLAQGEGAQMSQWNWKPERTQGVWRTGPVWLRPFLSAVPWITVLLLVLMFHIVGGTLVSSEGVLFDLPDSTGLRDDEPAPLVALVMPMSRETLPQQETLVFFDDGRYSLGDETSVSALVSHLEERAAKTERKTLLVLADKRVASGELIKFSGVAKRSGIERIFIAEKREGKSAE